MLVGINHLIGAPVMSLQTGQPLARLDSPIINPRNLRIVAFYVSGPKVDFKPAVVFTDDIREFGEIGAIVDSSDNVLSPEGMVRLLEVINYNFLLTGLPVSDDHHQKIGKVDSFTVDPVNFMIRQLYVKPTLLQRFLVANVDKGEALRDPFAVAVGSCCVRERAAVAKGVNYFVVGMAERLEPSRRGRANLVPPYLEPCRGGGIRLWGRRGGFAEH